MERIIKAGTTGYVPSPSDPLRKRIVKLDKELTWNVWLATDGSYVYLPTLEIMFYFLCYLKEPRTGRVVESGWMMAAGPEELIANAKSRHLDIFLEYKGQADLSKFACEIFE